MAYCSTADHPQHGQPDTSPQTVERAASMFRALGDPARLRLMRILIDKERCVSEIVGLLSEKFSTVSQRLRVLRGEGLVVRRREGTHLYYAIADRHVAEMVANALAHAIEPVHSPTRKGAFPMAKHKDHSHQHGPNCGHTPVKHDGHVDYLHDGHLHHVGADGVEEHKLEVSAANPADCTPKHACGGHDKSHRHGPGCGHEAVPHGDHVDYLVKGHLHHPHGDHCDDHGKVEKG